MDVLSLLRQEDDNPAGRGSKFRNGSTLEEAGEAEARRQERMALRWSLGRQEAGIIHLIQAKNFFQRLKLPEPRRNAEGNAQWNCSDATLQRTYDQAKMCCDPEWAHHPKRDQGFALLTEAMETLTDRNGRREAYIEQIAAEVEERDARLNAEFEAQQAKSTNTGKGAGIAERWSTDTPGKRVDEGAADVAAELDAQMAARRRKMRELEQARSKKPTASSSASASGPSRRPDAAAPLGPQRPSGGAPGPQRPDRGVVRAAEREAWQALLDDDDDKDDARGPQRPTAAAAAKLAPKKKPKRPGMF